MSWKPLPFSGAVGSAEQFDLAAHTVLDGLQLWLCEVPEPNGVRGLLEHCLDGEGGLLLQEGRNIDLGDAQLDDLLDILIHCAGGAVHDKWHSWHGFVQLAAECDVEMGCLDGHGVDRSNGYSQSVDVRIANKANRLVDRGVVHIIGLGACAVLRLADLADLRFDGHAYLVGGFDDLTRDGDVLGVWQRRTVKHDGAEPGTQSFDAAQEALAVIEVHDDGNGILASVVTSDHAQFFESRKIRATLRDLEDDRRLHLIRGFDNSLGIFQVVDIERTDRVVVPECVLCDFFQRYQHCATSTWLDSLGEFSVAGSCRKLPRTVVDLTATHKRLADHASQLPSLKGRVLVLGVEVFGVHGHRRIQVDAGEISIGTDCKYTFPRE